MKKKLSYLLVLCIMFITTSVNAGNSFSGGYKTACGFDYMPSRLPTFTTSLFNIIKLLIPVILIIMGMIDFTRAMMANEDKNMKEAQKRFINRLIASIVIFMTLAVVQFIFKSMAASNSYKQGFTNCMNCLLNNDTNSCGSGDKDLRKQCSDYEGRSCPKTDDYGHSCHTYQNGTSYGGCRDSGSKCAEFSSSECSKSKNNSGVACEYTNGTCREKCSYFDTDTCRSTSYCKWVGPDSKAGANVKSGYCTNK